MRIANPLPRLALSFALATSIGMAQPTITFGDTSVSKAGVVLVAPNTIEFDGLLALALAGRDPGILQRIAGYSVIIKNESTLPLAGVMVRYDLDLRDGRAVYWNFLKANLNGRPEGCLQPGQSYLVTPSGRTNQAVEIKSPSLSESGILHDVDHVQQFFTNTVAVHVTIDSVLFPTGRFIGPDRSKTFDRVLAWNRAEKDLSEQLHAADVENWSDDVITNTLASIKRPEGNNFDERDHYGIRQWQFAQSLLNVMTARGRTALFTEVNTFRNQATKLTAIYRDELNK